MVNNSGAVLFPIWAQGFDEWWKILVTIFSVRVVKCMFSYSFWTGGKPPLAFY